jgi:uncharacterized protein involved in cysteine biosynthesis
MDSSPNKLTAVIIAAAVMVIFSVVPVLNLVNLCCMGILAGGFAGVMYYAKQSRANNLYIQQKDAMLIGVFGGFIAALISTGANLAESLFSKTNPIAEMMEVLSQVNGNMPPQMMEVLDKFSQEYTKYGYSPTLTIITLIVNIVMYPLFGMLGSFIAFQISKKKNIPPPVQPNI